MGIISQVKFPSNKTFLLINIFAFKFYRHTSDVDNKPTFQSRFLAISPDALSNIVTDASNGSLTIARYALN